MVNPDHPSGIWDFRQDKNIGENDVLISTNPGSTMINGNIYEVVEDGQSVRLKQEDGTGWYNVVDIDTNVLVKKQTPTVGIFYNPKESEFAETGTGTSKTRKKNKVHVAVAVGEKVLDMDYLNTYFVKVDLGVKGTFLSLDDKYDLSAQVPEGSTTQYHLVYPTYETVILEEG